MPKRVLIGIALLLCVGCSANSLDAGMAPRITVDDQANADAIAASLQTFDVCAWADQAILQTTGARYFINEGSILDDGKPVVLSASSGRSAYEQSATTRRVTCNLGLGGFPSKIGLEVALQSNSKIKRPTPPPTAAPWWFTYKQYEGVKSFDEELQVWLMDDLLLTLEAPSHFKYTKPPIDTALIPLAKSMLDAWPPKKTDKAVVTSSSQIRWEHPTSFCMGLDIDAVAKHLAVVPASLDTVATSASYSNGDLPSDAVICKFEAKKWRAGDGHKWRVELVVYRFRNTESASRNYAATNGGGASSRQPCQRRAGIEILECKSTRSAPLVLGAQEGKYQLKISSYGDYASSHQETLLDIGESALQVIGQLAGQ